MIFMKSNKQDTSLIEHAHIMWEYRKRQREQDPEAYTNRLNQSHEQKSLRKEKDRNKKRLKRKQQKS